MRGTFFRTRGIGVLFFLFLAGVWEVVSASGIVSKLYFPRVSTILVTFWELTASGVLPLETFRSFARMGAGYGGAALTMIPLGVLMGVSRRAYSLFDPMIEFFRPLPPPAIIPAVMLFLGIGHGMKIFVIWFACSFPIVLNTADGVRQVPRLFIDTARSFSTGNRRLIARVILPCALPGIMSGLRISLPISLIVAVLSEMIGGTDGVGHFIMHMQRIFNIPEMYAGILMLGLVGYGLNAVFLGVDRTALSWYEGWKRSGR